MPDSPSADKINWWIGALGVAIAAGALLHDLIKYWLFRPKLSFKLSFSPPDCHRVKEREIDQNGYDIGWHWTYYFAVRILNDGRGKAENVAVKLLSLSEKVGSDWKPITEINPDRLLWRLTGRAYEPIINPQTYEHCNLGYIIDPPKRQRFPWENLSNNKVDQKETIFHIQVSAPSTNLPHLCPPGIYRLALEASCSNGKKDQAEIEIDLKGQWFEDEIRMLKDGIRIDKVQ